MEYIVRSSATSLTFSIAILCFYTSGSAETTCSPDDCECSVGDSGQNEPLEPEQSVGVFLLPEAVPFDGRLVSLNASGFCLGQTESPALMGLSVYQGTSNENIFTRHNLIRISASCDNSTDLMIGGIQNEVINVTVEAGNRLGILVVNGMCSSGGANCTFQPAISNTSGEYLYISRRFPRINLTGAQRQNGSLQVSFNIIRDDCESGTEPEPKVLVVALVLCTVIILLSSALIFLVSYMCVVRRRRRSKDVTTTVVSPTNPGPLSSFTTGSDFKDSVNYYSGEVRSPVSDGPTTATTITQRNSLTRTYDYAREEQSDFSAAMVSPLFSEGHYEFDTSPAEPYWEPATFEDELKRQLQDLVLQIEDLTLSGELGSGEFGVVRRGVWSVGGEEREVAVKSLADDSTEEKRIQFLQEAAIMGQFKHPNVITLHGVIMDQEPV